MYNDYEAMRIHKIREQESIKEAQASRLAAMVRGPKTSLGERFRDFFSSFEMKRFYLGAAQKSLDCVLLPSAC